MREVTRQELWLGTAADSRDAHRLNDMRIAAVVDLAFEELPAALPREFIYCRVPLVDGAGNPTESLRVAIEVTVSLIQRQVPTLVSCSGGMSRSPAIVAAGLALIGDESPDRVLQKLVADAPHDVSPSLWADVKAAYDQLK